MPSPHPKDRFDHGARDLHRVGAHRAPNRKGRGWVPFWWALAATVVLIAVGVFGILSLSSRLNISIPGIPTDSPAASDAPATDPAAEPTEEPPAEPVVEPTVDPSLSVTVLNGTGGSGVAGGVADLLAEAGWSIGATGDADAQDVPTTTVYYSDAALEGAARGVAASVAGSEIMLADDFADSESQITVVVGMSYAAPEG